MWDYGGGIVEEGTNATTLLWFIARYLIPEKEKLAWEYFSDLFKLITLSFTSEASMNWLLASILMSHEHLILFFNPLFQTFYRTTL